MFNLPPLPYAYDALEPTVSETTMRTHHDKHHKTYVETLNKLLAEAGEAPDSLEAVIERAAADKGKLFNNAGQAWNHGFFWECMTPERSEPIADIDLTSQKATFLNDVAVGGDGSVYITDTGLTLDAKGAMAHTGVDRIFKIAGGKAAELRVDSLDAPNGITWDKANGRFIVAPSNSTGVKTWREGDKATATLISGPGQYDGVEVLADGRLLVTSWADSAVHVLQNGTLSTMVSGVNGPADIGVDTKRNVLAIPRLADNKVEYYKIP